MPHTLRLSVTTLALSFLLVSRIFAADGESATWFDKPATVYTESCPIGNGRLGAMIFGDPINERIVLNETGMWSGSPVTGDRPDAFQYLPQIRQLIFDGKNAEALKLLVAHFTCLPEVSQLTEASAHPGKAPGKGSRTPFGCYQVLGSLNLKFTGTDAMSNYHRELDLTQAMATVDYDQGGVHYHREALASAPDDIIVIRLTASQPGHLSFTLGLDRPERSMTAATGADSLLMTGRLSDGKGGENVGFATRVKVVAQGGTVAASGTSLQINQADEVRIYVAAVTDIKTFSGRRADDPAAATQADIDQASAKSYDALRSAHIADYQQYYNRAALQFGPLNPAADKLPTPARLVAFAGGQPDPGLPVLYYNFGRYLFISASRPGGLPPNLQGLWSNEIQTAWNGDWHLDINLQEAYWGAEVNGLGDLTDPLFKFIASLQEPGAKTAKAYYNAHGWIVHVTTNPWGFTSPGWNGGVGFYAGAGAWLCQHLWDHYLFTQDRKFLDWAYPILKGSALFYSDMLVENPNHKGWLGTAPSNSPENSFIGFDGQKASVAFAPTMDMQQIRYLFGAVIDASKILGVDQDLRDKLIAQRAQLVPTRVSKVNGGDIMEWSEDYKEALPTHRHISPLWGLYPSNEITPDKTPELAAAAKATLNRREAGHSPVGSWSYAWKIIFWARLLDAEHAFQKIKDELQPLAPDLVSTSAHGGVYPNLMSGNPPYQFDGNQASTAALPEMILQSHEDAIFLLPALPDEWPEGSARGLHARGNFVVDFTWKDKKLTSATIHGQAGAPVAVRVGDKKVNFTIPASGELHLTGALKKKA